jgi:hypothetical protein
MPLIKEKPLYLQEKPVAQRHAVLRPIVERTAAPGYLQRRTRVRRAVAGAAGVLLIGAIAHLNGSDPKRVDTTTTVPVRYPSSASPQGH